MSVEDPSERCGTWLSVFTDEMKEHLFAEPYRQILNNLDMFEVYRRYWQQANHFTDYMNRILYVDFKSWLPDAFLEKIDKASMAASLEARVPFLDMALVEFAATIPFKYKIKNLKTKYILKRAMQGLVPASIMKKKKHGFAVPTDPWFRGELKQFVFDVLMDNRTLKRGYFNRDYIESLYKLHLSGREVYNAQLWLLLMFELWHREYYDNQS
jgi:asparagine synthase (glutamine-hydrolysing)